MRLTAPLSRRSAACSVTSTLRTARTCSRAASSRPWSRDTRWRLQPSRANSSAHARPMPFEPPVIRTVLPASLRSIVEPLLLPNPRMLPPGTARGSRRGQRPASTEARKSATARLNASGSSMLIVCPEHGRITRPEVGIERFMRRPASRHGSSSSPVMISAGTSIFFMPSTSWWSKGRRFCTPRSVSAAPFAECCCSASRNSRKPRGSFCSNCTRVGPWPYFAPAACMPWVSNACAAASHSARNFSSSPGCAP